MSPNGAPGFPKCPEGTFGASAGKPADRRCAAERSAPCPREHGRPDRPPSLCRAAAWRPIVFGTDETIRFASFAFVPLLAVVACTMSRSYE